MDKSIEQTFPDVSRKGTLPPLRHKQYLNNGKKSHFISARNFEKFQENESPSKNDNPVEKEVTAPEIKPITLPTSEETLKPEEQIPSPNETKPEEQIPLPIEKEAVSSKMVPDKKLYLYDKQRNGSSSEKYMNKTSTNKPTDKGSSNLIVQKNSPADPLLSNEIVCNSDSYETLKSSNTDNNEKTETNNHVYFKENFQSYSPPPNLLQYYSLAKMETLNTEKPEKTDFRKLAFELANCKKPKNYKRLKKYCDYILVFPSEDKDFISVSERALFETALRRDGLNLVYTEINSLMFVEIYAPFERLCKQAELVCLEMPLEGLEFNEKNSNGIIGRFFKLFKSDTEVDMLSAPFSNSSKEIFMGVDNKETFFRSAYRSMLVNHILENIKISLNEEHSQNPTYKTGIHALLHSKSYIDSFILHERSLYDSKYPLKPKISSKKIEQVTDSRRHLHNTWLQWMKYQPLWKIRNYYGEKIALYFAWIGVLISSLWIPMVLGLGVFTYGFVSSALDQHAKQGELNMTVKALESLTSKAMDNDATPYFAFAICIWGTVFLEIWKRKNASLAHKWDVENFEEQEVNRPQFYGTKMIQNPLTGFFEPYYPMWRKVMKSMGSAGIVLFMVFLVIVSVVSVVVYKVVSRVDWFSSIKMGTLASSLSSSLLNSISILVLGKIYTILAFKLTDWENHRTKTKYNDALILKLFGFQFVNSYASLFYIAFFREGTYDSGVFSMGRNYSDSCGENNDCMSLLSLQVAVLMIVKPLPKFFSDIIIPFVMKLLRRICCCFVVNKIQDSNVDLQDESDALYEQYLYYEYKKPILKDFTLSEYTEKVLQYGYLMLFAAAFPLAPLIALVTNVIDIRVDARRLLWFNRRPVAERAEDIGMWFTILSFLNFVGIFTNAFIIAITSRYGRQYQTMAINQTVNLSDYFTVWNTTSLKNSTSLTASINVNRDSYKYLWIIIIFENVVLAIKFIVAYIIPDVPAAVERAKRQERVQLENVLSKSGLKTGPGKSIMIQSPLKPVLKKNRKNTMEGQDKAKKRKTNKRKGKKKQNISVDAKNELSNEVVPSNEIQTEEKQEQVVA